MCLILNEFAILIRRPKFGELDFAQNLSCFSTKTSEKSKKKLAIVSREKNHLLKINEPPLLQEPLWQPPLPSVELFISDLIG